MTHEIINEETSNTVASFRHLEDAQRTLALLGEGYALVTFTPAGMAVGLEDQLIEEFSNPSPGTKVEGLVTRISLR